MMTTVCASCHTEFRVTWEQLKVRAGRVRCGQCQTVFNALDSLNRHGDEEPAPIADAAQPPAAAPEPAFPTPHAPVERDTTIAFEAASPATEPEPPPASALTPSTAESDLAWPPIDLVENPPTAPPDTRPEPDSEPQPALAPALVPPPPMVAPAPVAAPAAAPHSAAAVYDFGPKPATRRGWWWLPLALLLLIGLFAQALYYFRGAIALLLPEVKPYIIEACAELGCEVPLPRRAELISIETSDLQADPTSPGVMVLLATLRNRAAFPQAFPALELTLTNERDVPLARRVLQPGDYLADKTEAFEGSSEKQVRLHVEAAALKASGYRLYLFYP